MYNTVYTVALCSSNGWKRQREKQAEKMADDVVAQGQWPSTKDTHTHIYLQQISNYFSTISSDESLSFHSFSEFKRLHMQNTLRTRYLGIIYKPASIISQQDYQKWNIYKTYKRLHSFQADKTDNNLTLCMPDSLSLVGQCLASDQRPKTGSKTALSFRP